MNTDVDIKKKFHNTKPLCETLTKVSFIKLKTLNEVFYELLTFTYLHNYFVINSTNILKTLTHHSRTSK